MITPSASEQPVSFIPATARGDEWQTVIKLLKTQKYEDVIDRLLQQQTTAVLNNNVKQATLLGIATQICQTCVHHQSEIESYRQSQAQAMLREQELNQQLIRMFELMADSEPATPPAKQQERSGGFRSSTTPTEAHPQPPKRSSLWQRVQQTLLGSEQEEDTAVPPSSDGQTGKPAAEAENGEPFSESAAPIDTLSGPNDERQQPTLSVYCLGTFRAYLNGRLIDNWNGNKSKSIFKHMIIHRNRPANHEILMDLFWHGDDPEAARRNLYQAIYVIRQALQDSVPDITCIVCQDSAYSFNPQITIWVDSAVFEEHYQNGLHLQRQGKIQAAIREYELADSLYEGDFLREDIYEEWTLVHRERLKHAHLDILDRLSQYYWTEKQYPLSIAYGSKILQGDNCREDVHRRLMLAYLYQGQRHLALKQYHRCIEVLSEELGVEPMPETKSLYQRILNGEIRSN